MKKKKIVFVILIALIVLFICLLVREFKFDYDRITDKTKALSREEVITLLDKGATYNNYYRSVKTTNGNEEYYYKDNILACYINSKLYYWMNLSDTEKEMIIIEDYENKIANTVKEFDTITFPTEMTQLGYYCTVYDQKNFSFKYKGIMKFNDRDTYIVETSANNNFFSSLKIKYYIDKETGVIVNRKQLLKFTFITKEITEFDRGLKFDVVTDENIEKPNLTDFEIVETYFPALSIW